MYYSKYSLKPRLWEKLEMEKFGKAFLCVTCVTLFDRISNAWETICLFSTFGTLLCHSVYFMVAKYLWHISE